MASGFIYARTSDWQTVTLCLYRKWAISTVFIREEENSPSAPWTRDADKNEQEDHSKGRWFVFIAGIKGPGGSDTDRCHCVYCIGEMGS